VYKKGRSNMTKLDLHWITVKNTAKVPVSFGTPWKKGVLTPEEFVQLHDDTGMNIPVQTKINAYWPDGSVKWLLHSAVLDTRKEYSIQKGKKAREES
jgi:hypothetical protein